MKQFIVIGLGRFGSSVAQELCRLGHEVLAVDSDMERVEELAELVTHAVCCDAADEDQLRALEPANFDAAVVAIGTNLEASILVTMMLKEMGVKNVLVKAASEMNARVLQKVGADQVVLPEYDMGVRIARGMASASIMEYIELSPEYSLAEIKTPTDWEGHTLSDLRLRARHGVNVVAIRKPDGSISVTPQADDVLQPNDVLVVIGANRDIEKVQR